MEKNHQNKFTSMFTLFEIVIFFTISGLSNILVSSDAAALNAAEVPDIRSVDADLIAPEMRDAKPAAGVRAKQTLPGYKDTRVYHSIYLPTDYQRGDQKLPVLIELSGNGGFRSKHGDESIGRPEGSCLGYGISGGKKFIWVVLPFVNAAGNDVATKWWGDAPNYNPQPTIDYCTRAVPWICEQYGGDPERVVLIGFSRGAIACNYIGLYDDKISKLWSGFVAYSHYDGVRKWGYPKSDRVNALQRLARLGKRPQFICHEGNQVSSTKKYLDDSGVAGNFTFAATGFRNHNDQWTLRPSATREQLREWLDDVIVSNKIDTPQDD